MEFLTNGRDEVLKRVLDRLSDLIVTAAETIKHEEENFHRYAEYMIHVRELLLKLQSQQATIEPVRLLLRMETEVIKAREIIDSYKSKSRLLRPFIYRSVASKLNQSSNEIYAVLQLLPFTQINAALNIKKTIDTIFQGIKSLQLKLSTNSNAILSSLDLYISENSGNQQQSSHSLFMLTRSKGTASSSVCPLLVQIEAQESEGERSHIDSYRQLPPFFLCPLTGEVLEDPVSVSCDHSFERKAIEEYFHAGQNLCPLCIKQLSSTGKLELTSNSTLRISILEWKKREEQANAERNAKKKFIDAAAKINIDNMEITNQALSDLQSLMMEIPSCISAATESYCKLVPNLVELLKNNSSENTSTVLKCLILIARFSDENKEMIGKRGVIKCLLKQSMTEPNAVAVLVELSRNKTVAGKIGGIPYSIPILISILDNPCSAVAEMARTILENLCNDISSTVMMTKFGYFTPFLDQFNSQDISVETRAYMAEELSQIQLTETSSKNLQNERFIAHLIEMLGSDSPPPSKMAALNCIEQFITFNELKTFFLLQNESAMAALLRLITTKSIEQELKQKAVEILISLIQTTQPTNHGFQTLFSSNGLQDIVSQIKIAASDDQISLLRLLLAVAQNSDAAKEWIVSDDNAMSCLFSAINVEQNSEVKMSALKLIYCIAANHQRAAIPLPSSPSKESIVGSLITIFTESQIDDELTAAAGGILIHLPPDDETITEMLQSSAVLKSIHALMIPIHPNDSHLLLEISLGVLLRCVNQPGSNPEFQKKISKLLRSDLIRIISSSSGSPLARRRAAVILSRLTQCIMDSFPRRHPVSIRRSAKDADGGCPVHKSSCSLQRPICLAMDKAVKPLTEMVKSMEVGSTEAALMALDTLFGAGCDLNGAATVIVESGGATPILAALERGEVSVREKALELFCKIFEHPGITEEELDRFKGLVLNMVRNEDRLKIKVEKLLKDLLV